MMLLFRSIVSVHPDLGLNFDLSVAFNLPLTDSIIVLWVLYYPIDNPQSNKVANVTILYLLLQHTVITGFFV